MTIGLDLGSHRFRSIRHDSKKLIARSCPAVFATLADTPPHRRLLHQSGTRFATCADHLLLAGDAANEWSAMLNLPLFPLLKGGRVPTSDVIARQILTLMIDAMLPVPESPGGHCCLTIPGGQADGFVEQRDADFFQQMVSLRGYRPHIVSATQALVLAELHEASFTGIAISFGHTTSEFGVVHCGREIARCVIADGTSSFEVAQTFGIEEAGAVLAAASIERSYGRFFSDIVDEARIRFEREGTLKTLPQPLPVICTGGITESTTFLPMLQKIWDETGWQVSTLPIRAASDPVFAVARGCLIQAELERPGERRAA